MDESIKSQLLQIIAELQAPTHGRVSAVSGGVSAGSPATKAEAAERLRVSPERLVAVLRAEAATRDADEAGVIEAFAAAFEN